MTTGALFVERQDIGLITAQRKRKTEVYATTVRILVIYYIVYVCTGGEPHPSQKAENSEDAVECSHGERSVCHACHRFVPKATIGHTPIDGRSLLIQRIKNKLTEEQQLMNGSNDTCIVGCHDSR